MLNEYKIIELASHIAAPSASGILADWGGDVIKIEPPAGDPMRWARAGSPGGCSPTFETNNRGKRSLCLDISTPRGREILLRLLADANVFLTNLRPRALEKARLDWPTLHPLNPRLVYVSVSGYGMEGPDANTPAFDNAAYWSRSGMAAMTRPLGHEPFSIRQGSGDHTCGLATALAIVTGLLHVARTGRGQLVQTSLLRTGTFVMSTDLSNQIRLGELSPTQDRRHPANPINNFFRTRDGQWICVMPRSSQPQHWARMCAAIGAADLIEDRRFATAEARGRNSEALVAALDFAFARLSFAEVSAALSGADLVWSPVWSPEQVINDPQATAAGCFTEVEDEAGGRFLAPAPPVRFSEESQEPKGRVARLGEHTDGILAELGLTADDIAALHGENVIAPLPPPSERVAAKA
jgi:crotonobetainyl-CoA:carnitine CoA-transferase CaiB-like acyl-CoA transferase